jgi:hypothetical protein
MVCLTLALAYRLDAFDTPNLPPLATLEVDVQVF